MTQPRRLRQHPSARPFGTALAIAMTAVTLALAACGGSDGGSTSASTTPATVTAPSITSQPTSLTVSTGNTATFSVTASGGGTLGYQWYKDGTAVSGATSASYTIGAVTTASAGSYYVIVSNSLGSATSSTVTLTVSATPASGAESWNIATGENPEDLVENTVFDFTVTIDLGTQVASTSCARLLIGAASGNVTPITLDGTTVITLTRDTYGLSIESSLPDDVLVGFVLAGAYDGSVTFLGDSRLKLALNGVTIRSPDGPALNIQSGKRTFVELASGATNILADTTTWSDRTLADGGKMDLKATFFAEGALIFSGDGSLSITAASKHALASDDHVRVRNGDLTLYAAKKDGIRTNDAFIMDGGALAIETASGAGKGIKVEGKEDATQPLGFIVVNDGTLDILSYDKAITASWEGDEDGDTATTADDPDPRVTINGGTLTIATFGTPYEDRNTSDGDDSLSPEGIESKSVLTINGGALTITTTDDALNAGTGIVINGGRIYAKASANDAVDSNGTLTINGGLLVADGAQGAEGGLDCDQFTFKVTGGTFVGIGGRNSTPTRNVTTQNTVSLRNAAANTLLTLRDGSGNIAFAYLVPKATSAVLLSSPLLTTGTSYTVLSGGSLGSFTEDFHGLYSGSASLTGGTSGTTFTISSTVTAL